MTTAARAGRSPRGKVEQITLLGFIAIPFLALLAAVPLAWDRGLGWHDVIIATVAYAVACHGITMGFHRYFTHGSFRAGAGCVSHGGRRPAGSSTRREDFAQHVRPGPDGRQRHPPPRRRVTWSINSICHAIGERPFKSRDRSANVWWLAVLSLGESWHNLHHAHPTCARHGVDRGQLDSSARTIWAFEKLGWACEVRWPRQDRLAARRISV